VVELAVCFLEADPWFFRSGYIKADLIKYLRRAPLSDDQKRRLRAVILDRIRGHATREFRSCCQLARMIADESLVRQITELASSTDPLVSRHARWTLQYLRSVPT